MLLKLGILLIPNELGSFAKSTVIDLHQNDGKVTISAQTPQKTRPKSPNAKMSRGFLRICPLPPSKSCLVAERTKIATSTRYYSNICYS